MSRLFSHSSCAFLGTTALFAATIAFAPAAQAQVVDTVRVATGLAQPLYLTTPPNEDRLFVLEQTTARIRIVDNGTVLPAPFLDIGAIASGGGERGLLGLAFHPDYEDNGYFFVNYTNNAGNTVVARYTRLNADQADPASEVVVLTQNQPFSNHNGGCLQFGPDGFLYIGFGDGGSANDPSCNAQNMNTLLGKLLRINVDTIDSLGMYSVPATNPFVGVPLTKEEIYMSGLRNPWRFSFDRLTGDLYIGDVGQNAREEIDYAAYGTGAGQNLGWRLYEGFTCIGYGNCATTLPGCAATGVYTDPIYEYTHAGGACSVTGGYVYRGCAIPAMTGQYFFADYCSSQISTFEVVGGAPVGVTNRTADLAPGGGQSIISITSFGQDRQGELYIIDQNGGEIFKILPQGAAAQCEPLLAEFSIISVADGGVQNLFLDAGLANAGALYLLNGSATGTIPGIPFGGFTIPLNFDAYLVATLKFPNLPPLDDSLGLLDASGRATASFSADPGTLKPGLVGLELNHAFVVLSPLGALNFVSNAVSVLLGA